MGLPIVQKPSLLSIFMAFASWGGKGRQKARKEQFRSSQMALPIIDSHTLRMMMLRDQNAAKRIRILHD